MRGDAAEVPPHEGPRWDTTEELAKLVQGGSIDPREFLAAFDKLDRDERRCLLGALDLPLLARQTSSVSGNHLLAVRLLGRLKSPERQEFLDNLDLRTLAEAFASDDPDLLAVSSLLRTLSHRIDEFYSLIDVPRLARQASESPDYILRALLTTCRSRDQVIAAIDQDALAATVSALRCQHQELRLMLEELGPLADRVLGAISVPAVIASGVYPSNSATLLVLLQARPELTSQVASELDITALAAATAETQGAHDARAKLLRFIAMSRPEIADDPVVNAAMTNRFDGAKTAPHCIHAKPERIIRTGVDLAQDFMEGRRGAPSLLALLGCMSKNEVASFVQSVDVDRVIPHLENPKVEMDGLHSLAELLGAKGQDLLERLPETSIANSIASGALALGPAVALLDRLPDGLRERAISRLDIPAIARLIETDLNAAQTFNTVLIALGARTDELLDAIDVYRINRLHLSTDPRMRAGRAAIAEFGG